MKKDKIIYWTFTILAMLLGAAAAPFYFTQEGIAAFKQAGFPDFFRIELATAKILGFFIILLPMVPARVKEWAYVGFGITFISAIILHFNIDGADKAIMPFIALCLLITSYIWFHKTSVVKATL